MWRYAWIVLVLYFGGSVRAASELPLVEDVEAQPLIAQALRLVESLSFLGSSLQPQDAARLQQLQSRAPDASVVREIQEILDPYCLLMLEINPEARVKVLRGPARAELVQYGWRSFLVKVQNDAAVTAQVIPESPNAAPLLHRSTAAHRVKEENILTPGDVANRFLEVAMYRNRPMLPNLSGIRLEYVILQVYTKAAGRREAQIGFNVGHGTQDVGFRSAVSILFDTLPSVKVILRVQDHDGSPTVGSFVITDGIERVAPDPEHNPFPSDYRLAMALRQPWDRTRGEDIPLLMSKRLVGVYPLPSRRIVTEDEYPDFFFHPQVYRRDGEHVYLPPGRYQITATRGPEYLAQTHQVVVPSGASTHELSFRLRRWVDLAALGWYSGDHHVHAAGCSHYESPTEGVHPEHMWRQIVGEDLNVASVLSWGPSWYYQKQFFEGSIHPLSNDRNLMRYDVEVSGFPSSHAGHLCLLRLKEDDYPGTTLVEEWPSWTVPVLKWGQTQGAVVGYSHSGWGLEPMERTTALPNYALPKFDGIGANEYIVAVTEGVVDFISAGDTPWPWELNIWYHTLNNGFRTSISGETDFPCIFDNRVGMARSYVKIDGRLDFDRFAEGIKQGRSYVSDGQSHLVDFSVNGFLAGSGDRELRLDSPQTVAVTARVAAYLPEEQDEIGAYVASRPVYLPPYWNIERARIGKSRRVPVELIVNGEMVERREIIADGNWTEVSFQYALSRSSWVALRIPTSSHTNPIFASVGGKPIRASRRSAEWSRRAVDRCWEMKSPRIRESERMEAQAAYDRARAVYERIIRESPQN